MTRVVKGQAKLPLPSGRSEEGWRNWFDRAAEVSGKQFPPSDIDDIDDDAIRDEMIVLPYEDQSPRTSFQTLPPE